MTSVAVAPSLWPSLPPPCRLRLTAANSTTANDNDDASSLPSSSSYSGSCCRLKAPIIISSGSCWSHEQQNQSGRSTRREVFFAAALPLLTLLIPNYLALAQEDKDSFRLYSDVVNKFQILIPPDWQVGSGEGDGIRSLTAFYPQEPSNSNVSLVITGLGADFTRLESFGKVDAFAENLVSGLDRSWKRPPGVAAKLINSNAANGLYYIEYTLQNPGESRRHLFSVLGIGNNGWINRLYTLTGQFVEEEADKYGSTIEKAVASFRLN